MSCEETTGHCIVELPEGTFSVCCPPLFDGPGEASGTPGNNPECWVGLPGSTSSGLGELREILGCDTGCIPCRDEPSLLMDMADSLHGSRWLAPNDRVIGSRDARGLLHDLRSGEGHLVPTAIVYRRGTCWSNDGRECFDHNVCTCWGVNEVSSSPPVGSVLCDDGTAVGGELKGLFADRFFYVGNRWPFRNAGQTVVGGQGVYCRKFPDSLDRLSPDRDHLVAASAPALFGVPDPIFLHTGGPDDEIRRPACSTNYFVPCTAFNQGGVCPGAFSNVQPGPDPQPPPVYYNDGGTSRRRFDRLRILKNTAQLRDDSPLFPLADKSQIAARNRILDLVAGSGFGVDGGLCQPGGTDPRCIDFQQLDYQLPALGNSAVGSYWRVWSARHLPIEDRPEVPGVFGVCELEQSGCLVDCTLRVDFILFQVQLYAHRLQDDANINRPKFVDPHARARILVECSVEASFRNSDAPCVLSRPWRDVLDPGHTVVLGFRNPGADALSRDTFIAQCLDAEFQACLDTPPADCFRDPLVIDRFTDDGARARFCCEQRAIEINGECQRAWDDAATSDRFATVIPEAEDRIIFRNPDGDIFRPPLRTEWWGYLGYANFPINSVTQRFGVTPGEIGVECGAVADGFRDLIIPGWPSMADDNDGVRPDHIYGGELRVSFL